MNNSISSLNSGLFPMDSYELNERNHSQSTVDSIAEQEIRDAAQIILGKFQLDKKEKHLPIDSFNSSSPETVKHKQVYLVNSNLDKNSLKLFRKIKKHITANYRNQNHQKIDWDEVKSTFNCTDKELQEYRQKYQRKKSLNYRQPAKTIFNDPKLIAIAAQYLLIEKPNSPTDFYKELGQKKNSIT